MNEKLELLMFAALSWDVPFSLTLQIPTDGAPAFWRCRLGVEVFDGGTPDNVLHQASMHVASNYRGRQRDLEEDDESCS